MVSAVAPASLARARELIEPALREAIQSLGPTLRIPSTYHLGWSDTAGNSVSGSSGKGIRSTLVMLGAEAVGGEARSAVPAGVAVELIHNFSLVHDDIMDGDEMRRHRPTVWAEYGVGDAILVGDALHALAHRVLLGETPTTVSMTAALRLAQATAAMIEGQALDIDLDRSEATTLAGCIKMEEAKTGALLAHSVAMGGVVGGGSSAQVEALETYGNAVGLAFQAVDDDLGIWGDPAQTGKPAGNDLRERKKSLPVAMAFEAGGALAGAMRDAFASELDDTSVLALAEQLERAGIRDRIASLAADQLGRATEVLTTVEMRQNTRAELVELAEFVVRRRA